MVADRAIVGEGTEHIALDRVFEDGSAWDQVHAGSGAYMDFNANPMPW